MSIKDRLPKSFVVGDSTYTVEYVDAFFPIDGEQLGNCDPNLFKIQVLNGQSDRETLSTLIHELLHALTYEHGVNLRHKLIHQLERPLASLIMKNFLND